MLRMWRVSYIGEEVVANMLEMLLERLGTHLLNSGIKNLVVGCAHFSFIFFTLL